MKVLLKQTFDKSFMIFAVLAVVTGTACYLELGRAEFSAAIAGDAALVAFLVPKLGAALLVAAFVQALLPPSFFARYMGDEKGIKGMAIAAAGGTVTPGGPMTSFPLVTVLRDSGTGIGSLVSYLTAWTTTGLQRIFMWEVPLMGAEFAAVRFIASMPLAIIAGVLARLFPAAIEARARQGE
ncbi:MAG: permease [Dongiaceae bacterium]